MPAKGTTAKAATARWICPSCGKGVATAFCPRCGEKPPARLTLRHLASQVAAAFSSLDTKVARTFRTLVTQPGALTVAFVEGRRKPYLGPFQVFLSANAVFFAVQSVSKVRIFSTTLHAHLTEQDWASGAQTLLTRHLAARHVTYAQYQPLFDQAATLNAKTLIILMVLVFAGVLPLVFLGNRRPLAAHVVFSLHFYAFVLLLFCVALGASALDTAAGGGGLTTGLMDIVLSLFNIAVCAVYLFLAVGRVYGERGAWRIAKVAGLLAVVAAMVPGYRFAILLITLATT